MFVRTRGIHSFVRSASRKRLIKQVMPPCEPAPCFVREMMETCDLILRKTGGSFGLILRKTGDAFGRKNLSRKFNIVCRRYQNNWISASVCWINANVYDVCTPRKTFIREVSITLLVAIPPTSLCLLSGQVIIIECLLSLYLVFWIVPRMIYYTLIFITA